MLFDFTPVSFEFAIGKRVQVGMLGTRLFAAPVDDVVFPPADKYSLKI